MKKVRNPNIEIRNKRGPNKPQNYKKFKTSNPKRARLGHSFDFDHLNLFRISEFDIRVFNFLRLGVFASLGLVSGHPLREYSEFLVAALSCWVFRKLRGSPVSHGDFCTLSGQKSLKTLGIFRLSCGSPRRTKS